MTEDKQFDAIFSGVIGQEYDLLKLICPMATEMSRLVGLEVGKYPVFPDNRCLQILELGGGTGITTLNILQAREKLHIISIDNESTMQEQAIENLQYWVKQKKITFSDADALTALKSTASASVDIIASAYTVHNFLESYRQDVINEIFRVLKSGGQFINGDRYALDDVSAHTRKVQTEVSSWFKVLTEMQRLDILEHWVIHLLSDESENHVMRESKSSEILEQAGFIKVRLTNKQDGNALLTAFKQ